MRGPRLRWCHLFGAVVILCACAGPAVKIRVTMPAEIDLRGIKRIAIGEIKGGGGQSLHDALETALTSSARPTRQTLGPQPSPE